MKRLRIGTVAACGIALLFVCTYFFSCPAFAQHGCVGDCDEDRHCSISELVTIVNVASGAMANQDKVDGSNCCEPRPNETGCDDPTCEEAVCGIDPFCCHVVWDDLCAVTAESLCPEVCPSGVILTSLPVF